MSGETTMTGTVPTSNARQLLLWVAARPRTYAEAMEAWRTSCPRLSVWEDAVADELIWVDAGAACCQSQAAVRLTVTGSALLGLGEGRR